LGLVHQSTGFNGSVLSLDLLSLTGGNIFSDSGFFLPTAFATLHLDCQFYPISHRPPVHNEPSFMPFLGWMFQFEPFHGVGDYFTTVIFSSLAASVFLDFPVPFFFSPYPPHSSLPVRCFLGLGVLAVGCPQKKVRMSRCFFKEVLHCRFDFFLLIVGLATHGPFLTPRAFSFFRSPQIIPAPPPQLNPDLSCMP